MIMRKIPKPDLTPKLSAMTPRAHRKWMKGRKVWPALDSPMRRVSWRHPGLVADAIEDGRLREEAKVKRSGYGAPPCGPIDFAALTKARHDARAVAPPVFRVSPRESLIYAYKNPRHMGRGQ